MKKIPVRHIAGNINELHTDEKFTIRNISDVLGGNDLMHELHRHDFFFLLFLQGGEGTHEIDFTTYHIQDKTVFFLKPGQVHQLQLKKDCTGFLTEFNLEFYRPANKLSLQRLKKASSINHYQPGSDRFEKLNFILKYIFREYVEKEDGYFDVIRSNLDIFFIELIRHRQAADPGSIPGSVNSYAQQRFEEFLELLEINITTHKKVQQYANLMNLSTYQLNEITKVSIGKTVSELINDQILLEAKRYLLATAHQIKEIADQLGYEDVSYFIRFFKKHMGKSPELFRDNFQ